jgi:hypothetical protein
MNPIKLVMFALAFMQLNRGQSAAGRRIIKEALDVIRVLGSVAKDGRVTKVEKAAVIKEIDDFHRAAVALLEAIEIPE